MKKKIPILLLSIIFLINTALAYTVTIIIDDVRLEVTRDVGKTVELVPELDEIEGWTVNTGNTTIVGDHFTMPEGDVVIEAIMSDDGNEGGDDDDLEEENNVYILTIKNHDATIIGKKTAGTQVIVTATAGDLEVFSNWTVEEGGITLTPEQQVNPILTFTMPENNVVLEANYLDKYTVTYNANGGTLAPKTQIKIEGESLTISSERPTRAGYTFTGWNTSLDGTGDSYYPVGMGEPTTYTIDANVTLYAGWAPVEEEVPDSDVYTVTVIYDTGGELEGTDTTTRCSECGGKDHECEVVNITIDAGDAEIEEQ